MTATRPAPFGGDPFLHPEAEAFLARLTRAAYDVALRHGIKGAFTDLELALWRELRQVVRSEQEPGPVVCHVM